MKKLLLTLPLLILFFSVFAQKQIDHPLDPERLNAAPGLEPFYHGVASGDPLSDAVIIWTRVTSTAPSVDVDWYMALDTGMTQIVAQGLVTTDASKDYTVKVDVTGLDPYTTYYYDFKAEGRYSLRGRTKTAPVGDTDSLRFAVVSCSSYDQGYFNAYQRIALRNDLDAVIHLGDYIYEYEEGDFGTVRQPVPQNEIITLSDYRMRHSHYKLDEDLRDIHQNYPFITTWDDHETANNSWFGGADNHNTGEGDWFDRKSAGIRAYYEWMPLRKPDPSDDERIYRQVSYGDLADFFVLDTRLEGREEQDGTSNNSPTRSILGPDQFEWLTAGMKNSNAQWKVLAQQVMMAPLEIFGSTVNEDQWDGYAPERRKLYDTLMMNNIQDMVVLTGDIHTSWANDLPLSGYNSGTGANSAGVEFITPSITSPGLPINIGVPLLQLGNPHMKYINLDEHGYYVLSLNKLRTQADWYYVTDIDAPSNGESYVQTWYTNTGSRHLTQGNSQATAPASVFTIQPPADPRPPEIMSGNTAAAPIVFLGAYPNPFDENFMLQYYMRMASEVQLSVVDVTGKVLIEESLGLLSKGIQRTLVNGTSLPTGSYFVTLRTEGAVFQRMLVKVKF